MKNPFLEINGLRLEAPGIYFAGGEWIKLVRIDATTAKTAEPTDDEIQEEKSRIAEEMAAADEKRNPTQKEKKRPGRPPKVNK